jgi:hypothetical protein
MGNHGMVRLAGVLFLALALVACASLRYARVPTGTFSGKLDVQWDGSNRFIYAPRPGDELTYVTSSGDSITPERMYTDGGSIPRLLWGFSGLSPWDYGPAYVIHDWLFERKHCRYPGWTNVSFEQSGNILAEGLKTLMASGTVEVNPEALVLIRAGVLTPTARRIWDDDSRCSPVPATLVEPITIFTIAAPGS